MKNTTLCYLEKDGAYLMLHRVKKKNDVNEGKWVGVGGHFEEGESPYDCAVREIFEETGIICGKLSPLYRLVREQSHIIFNGFLLLTDCDKDSIVLQAGETAAYRWISAPEFVRWYDEENEIPSVTLRLRDYVDSLR